MLIYPDLSGNGKGTGFVKRAEIAGSFTGVGGGLPVTVLGLFNAALTGTFTATVVLQRSFDNGFSWQALTALGYGISFTAPCEETFEENEPGVLYRWYCSSYSGGTVNYRISQ